MSKPVLVKLTDPAGRPVYIATSWVQSVSIPKGGIFPKTAKAVLELSGRFQAVTESPERVVAMLEFEGGE